jgi:DNA-binding transcriptional ArsR family regulator
MTARSPLEPLVGRAVLVTVRFVLRDGSRRLASHIRGANCCRTSVVPRREARPRGQPPSKTQNAVGVPLHAAAMRHILNLMVQYMRARLDASFAALSDATRRGVLEQLGRSDASITDLAEKFHMTLTGMKKHVGVLEQSGLVTTEKLGRVRTCKLGPRRLEEETAWLERYRQLWDARFDELDKVVEELKRKEKVDGRKKRE